MMSPVKMTDVDAHLAELESRRIDPGLSVAEQNELRDCEITLGMVQAPPRARAEAARRVERFTAERARRSLLPKKSHAQIKREVDDVLARKSPSWKPEGRTVWKTSFEIGTPGATEVLTVLRDGGYKLAIVDRGPVRYTYHTTAPLSAVSAAIRQIRNTGLQFGISNLEDLTRMGVVTDHATMKKLDPYEARQRLETAGIDFSSDFHQLPRSQVQRILDTARAAKYQKRKDAAGSTARMYFQYLSRLR